MVGPLNGCFKFQGFFGCFLFSKLFFFGGADFAEVGFLVKSDFLSSFICVGALWGGKKSAKRLQDSKNVG